jgi:hypothetical protein
LSERREASLTALDDDFAFVAQCNLGGEAMAEADLATLERHCPAYLDAHPG